MTAWPVKAVPGAPSAQSPIREAITICRTHFGYALIFSALVNLAYLAPTLYMLQVYDRVVPSGSRSTLVFLTLALAATLFVLTFLDRIRSRILMAASVRLDKAFSARLFRRALSASRLGAQPRMNQQVRDFDAIRAAATGPAALALFDAPWIPIYIVICFLVHPWIGTLAFFGAMLLFSLAVLNERATRHLNKLAADATAASFSAQEAASASPHLVRALGMGPAFVAQFEDARAKAAQPLLQGVRTTGRIGGIIRFLRLFLQSLALGLGAWLAVTKQVSAGAIFASSMLAARALSPIDQIVAQWRTLSAAIIAYGNVRDQLEADNPIARTWLPTPVARLSIKNASVLTPARDRALLQSVSFAVEPGTVLGVLGSSGAGKTTLLQTIANARDLDQGELRLDGAIYADWSPERLGKMIGYLPQDSALFPGSIADNISRFARWDGSNITDVDAKVIAAAKAARIHDMILALPGGYNAKLGPLGRGLSAGQQQRVALARALYGEPPIYVLDEPNSNADAEAEDALLKVIADLKVKECLIIVAAHRVSLVAAVDVVAVLHEGRLERFGPRDEVMSSLKPRPPAIQNKLS